MRNNLFSNDRERERVTEIGEQKNGRYVKLSSFIFEEKENDSNA